MKRASVLIKSLLLFVSMLMLFGLLVLAGQVRQSRPQPPVASGKAKPAVRDSRERRKATASRPTAGTTKAGRRVTTKTASAQVAERESRRYDQPDEAAEFYLRKRLPVGETELPVERYFAAQEQMEQMAQYATAEERVLPPRAELKNAPAQAVLGTWTPLGPGNIGGRTRALLIHPFNPQTMYAAGVAGGVWKTTNGGGAWTPMADLLANIAVSALALDPRNPEVLYAGTGEGYGNSDGVRGAGIFKTTDGGASWTRLNNTGTPDFHYVNDIVVSPNDSQRVYAATRTGVWRSLDGGASWTRTLNPAINGGCLDLAIRTDQTGDYLFASCGTLSQASIYRNTNAASTDAWIIVLNESGMGRTSLALAPSNQNVIYAAAASINPSDYQHGLHAIFRSTSSGDSGTWTAQVRNTNPVKLNTLLFTNPREAFRSECFGGVTAFFNQGWYDNALAVDPADPNRVWAGGIDLFRSDDGGQNWGLASYWWANERALQYAHADQHAIVFHPQYNGASNRIMYATNDGGIFRTDDARAATARGANAPCNPNNGGVSWTPLNNGYGVTQFYHGLPYPDGATYFGGAQDNGTLRGSDADGANNWQRIVGGDGGYVAIDPTNTNIIYAEYQHDARNNPQILKATDGITFLPATNGIADGGFIFIPPFVMDPANPQRLWTGGRFLWRTDNAAARWSQASQPITNGGISAIAIAPSDSNLVLAGASMGRIARTTSGLSADANTIWTFHQTPRGINGSYISWLTFDPTNVNVAYATIATFNSATTGSGHVFKSTDGGQTWAAIDGSGANSIPDVPVHCIVVDPANPTRLYVGTDLGVFTSLDGGGSWRVEYTGFPNVITESLALNTVGGVSTLFAFTHGRGAWRVPVGEAVACNYSLAPTSQSFSAAGGTGSVNITAPNTCAWQAASNANWITITSSASGAGNGTVNYTVAANSTANQRTGTLTIAGQTFTVTQAGGGPDPCLLRTPISSGQTLTGSLSSSDCRLDDGSYVDFYSFSGVSGQQIAINLDSTAFDAYLFLRNPEGVTIAQNNNGGGGLNARIPANSGFFTLPATGVYVILANSLNANETGDYSLRLTAPATNVPLTSGVPQTGSLPAPPANRCSLADTQYTIQTTASTAQLSINLSGNHDVDVYARFGQRIEESANNQFVADHKSDSPQNSETLTITPSASPPLRAGTYFIGVTNCGPGAANYTISATVTQVSNQTIYTLAASPDTVAAGGQLTISWTAPAGRPDNDWIGLHKVGDSDRDYTWWQYTRGQSSGSFTLTAPTQAGQYDFRYFLEGTYNRAARSNPVTVTAGGPSCTYTISPASQNFPASGGTGSLAVTAGSGCSWQAVSNANFITITSGASGNGNGSVAYSVAANSGSSARQGTLTIAGQTLTVTQAGGQATYTLVASPDTVTAGGQITISWTAPAGRPGDDWIGIHKVGDSDRDYTWWQYTRGQPSGSFTMTAPSQPGQYDFRYFLEGTYNRAARSNPVTVNQ